MPLALPILLATVARVGNVHLDLPPCSHGSIPMLQQERLVQMIDWFSRVNAAAIYGTRRRRTTHEGPLVPTYDPRLDKERRWTVGDEIPKAHCTQEGINLHALCLSSPGEKRSLRAPTPSGAEFPCWHAWAFELAGLRNVP